MRVFTETNQLWEVVVCHPDAPTTRHYLRGKVPAKRLANETGGELRVAKLYHDGAGRYYRVEATEVEVDRISPDEALRRLAPEVRQALVAAGMLKV